MLEYAILGTVFLNIYAVLLIFARAVIFRTRLYRPMLWNIFLSIMPIVVFAVGGTIAVLTVTSKIVSLSILAIFGIIWLLLLPNASYLITELNQSHRQQDDPVPLWFDIILTLSLAMSGVVNAIVNVFIVQIFLTLLSHGESAEYLMSPSSIAFAVGVMLLLGFGMYLGRYPRFNSWDLWHPRRFFSKLTTHFSDRRNVGAGIGFTLTHAVFLIALYSILAGPIITALIEIENLQGS